MSTHQPDIIIRCNHGLQDGPKDFVQRYRWLAESGVFVPTDTTNEAITYGRQIDGGRLASTEDIGTARERQAVHCNVCHDKVVMTGRNRLQFALRKLAEAGQTSVMLPLFRRVYDLAPKHLG
jgi:hypothetical protein